MMNHPIKMRSHRPPSQRSQHGVSLIEVLVAILVIALGILTMLAMQINSTKLTKTSETRAMGALLVSDLADRMRANRTGFEADNYKFTETTDAPTAASPTCDTDTSNCSAAEMAAKDKYDWLTNIRRSLPSGTARISERDKDTAKGKNGVDVWLIWLDPQETNNASGPSPTACPDDLLGTLKNASAAVKCMYFRINV